MIGYQDISTDTAYQVGWLVWLPVCRTLWATGYVDDVQTWCRDPGLFYDLRLFYDIILISDRYWFSCKCVKSYIPYFHILAMYFLIIALIPPPPQFMKTFFIPLFHKSCMLQHSNANWSSVSAMNCTKHPRYYFRRSTHSQNNDFINIFWATL